MPKASPSTCRHCWFSGMEPKTSDPHGPYRWTCCLAGAPTSPRATCRRFVADKGRAPSSADYATARAA